MLRSLVALSLAVALLPSSARAFPISTCGMLVPDGDSGTLAADLNCTDPGTPAVRLGHRATLELAGHTIQGISAEPMVSHNVISCLDTACTIIGPGGISGNDGTVNYGVCVFGPVPGLLTMTSDGQGEITVSNCGTGIAGGKGKLQDVHAESNMAGISLFQKAKLANVTASGNQFGVIGNRIHAVKLTASTNTEFGVVGNGAKGKVTLLNLTATGNGDAGVIAYGVTIKTGTVTGNNGYAQGIDVVSAKMPHVSVLSCGLSGKIGEPYFSGPPPLLAGTWGICTGD
jgi:hypothetical protein